MKFNVKLNVQISQIQVNINITLLSVCRKIWSNRDYFILNWMPSKSRHRTYSINLRPAWMAQTLRRLVRLSVISHKWSFLCVTSSHPPLKLKQSFHTVKESWRVVQRERREAWAVINQSNLKHTDMMHIFFRLNVTYISQGCHYLWLSSIAYNPRTCLKIITFLFFFQYQSNPVIVVWTCMGAL